MCVCVFSSLQDDAEAELRKTAKFAVTVYHRSAQAQLIDHFGAASPEVEEMAAWIDELMELKPQFENWR